MILVVHGRADSTISMDQFAGLAKELETAGVDHEMITYGWAQHAFTVIRGQPLSGDGRQAVLEALY
jgi:dienelactone hydrolase